MKVFKLISQKIIFDIFLFLMASHMKEVQLHPLFQKTTDGIWSNRPILIVEVKAMERLIISSKKISFSCKW